MVATDILDFQNFNFSTVRTVNRVDRTASLCQISSKSLELRPRYGDIFRCFKMVAAAILDFKNFRFLTVGTVKKVELHQCAKCHRNRSNRGRDMWDYEFATLTWKCLFTPLLGFFGGHISPNVTHRHNPKKDHPWAEPRHLSHKPRIFSYLFLNGPYKSPLFPLI